MSSTWRAIGSRILTPGVSNAKLSVRGFHDKGPAARELLETAGRSFLRGYAIAAEARTPDEPEPRLELVPRRFRGFAYEGAAMAFAVRDALPFGRGGRTARFLAGSAARHSYLVHVGIGWAMARAPRFRWSRLLLADPLLRWLALDGYGFHQAYFHTHRYLRGQHRDQRLHWPPDGPSRYAERAVDQGVGRAAWFVGGADPEVVADLLDSFPEHRRADLYSGAGLAATYAGGADAAELRLLRSRAGAWRPALAQGSAFGATARVAAGLADEHTALATGVLCGRTPEEAAALCDRTRPPATAEVPEHPGVPSYEVWRERIAAAFVTDSGVTA
ncbi:DUF1702 family protein [Saccharothrix australiensis]|uniref:Uncharacterized protein DUF1702 n=1 Tax=Saccharothrix australiensis TaxID=2072 RepID=A0A495W366_9PSEU|nr:DUF1702 family protein [Saccharothrix australiensis]RKT55205.1 uncharacterized protein DUF1702 [Saccharothrix australiensis]